MNRTRRGLPPLRITRSGLGYFVMGLIVLCGAVWSFGALVEIGNTATDKANLTTLPSPVAGYLFAGSVDLFIFFGYLKCYGPAWQIALAVVHILAGLLTSVWLQYQHSKGIVDPVLVSVIPAIAVAVSLDTWVVSQLIDWRGRATATPPPEPAPAPPPAAVAAEAWPSRPRPPRPRPAAARSAAKLPAVSKTHQVQLDRANKQGPVELERVMVRLGVPREAVAARPGRWELPSDNGIPEEANT